MKVVLISLEEYTQIYNRQPLVPEFSSRLAGAGFTNLVEGDTAYVPWSDDSAWGAPWERETRMNPTQFVDYWVPTIQRGFAQAREEHGA